jgi:uncharacterized protein YqfA (UPF0365 family)
VHSPTEMTRAVKSEKMECDRCKKELDPVVNKGEEFYILSVDIGHTRIGVTLNSEVDADEIGATSTIESDLCSSCYKAIITILRKELRNDQ